MDFGFKRFRELNHGHCENFVTVVTDRTGMTEQEAQQLLAALYTTYYSAMVPQWWFGVLLGMVCSGIFTWYGFVAKDVHFRIMQAALAFVSLLPVGFFSLCIVEVKRAEKIISNFSARYQIDEAVTLFFDLEGIITGSEGKDWDEEC